jgi:hypothetical protein
MTSGTRRELLRVERAALRKLVKDLCANYNSEYGCLLLDGDCYMFCGMTYTNTAMCRYFREAVLPTDPILEATLTGAAMETRSCPVCDAEFPANGKKIYCSDACADEAKKKKQRKYMRDRRC